MHLEVPHFLGLLVLMLAGAKLFGTLAQRIGQPAVLGELVAGVVLGIFILKGDDDYTAVLHLIAELGVIILLFEIGLETDLRKLLHVGAASAAVAIVGVVLPFILGYGVCIALGQSNMIAIVAGATLTATSVGITARVLSDLNRLQDQESQIILGAAIIDDIIGLIILAVVAGLTHGEQITFMGIVKPTAAAFGFLIGVLLIGRIVVPPIMKLTQRAELPGMPTMFAIMLAFGLAWLASQFGSAVIIGAFAAGILLRTTPQAHEVERGVAQLGHFFVPLFFVVVGAAVDLRTLNPLDPANFDTLKVGGALLVAAILGKFLAGYAPFWYKGNKKVIGVGMIPRGEVGLIFAQMGMTTGVFKEGMLSEEGMLSAITLVVMLTTFMAPPLLKLLLPAIERAGKPGEYAGIEELVNRP